MAWDNTIITACIAATSALSGAVIGSVIPWIREAVTERKKRKVAAAYLAILVVAHLKRFVETCSSIVDDDGTIDGHGAGAQGEHDITTNRPKFDPLALDVDWKSLPASLMSQILNLPHREEDVDREVRAHYDNDDVPYYTEYFFERQMQYAVLGIEVAALTVELNVHTGLNSIAHAHWFDRESSRLNDRLNSTVEKRKQRNAKIEARCLEGALI